ncbi:hypothetical protein EPN28_04935 [Patescibacteria group bacterium]|nr:MAG: hypothetical protein EPN28_04935 [Patescibacteria group bacterium]
MAVGSGGQYTPISARVIVSGSGQFDVTIFGTPLGSVIKLTGLAETRGAGITDDSVDGAWQTQDAWGDWSAFHHDRRNPKCPAVEIGNGLHFRGDVSAARFKRAAESIGEQTILEGMTNIVSSGMRVTLPDGNSVDVPSYTDIFSPSVNFIDSFRFTTLFPGLPVSGGNHAFALLDIFGQPIPGATSNDVWNACLQDAPRNVSAIVNADGILATWNPVPVVPGFDPSGSPSLGFYQIEIRQDLGGDLYGASLILNSSHLIPFLDFGGVGPGVPDGNNFGSSLLELGNGTYVFDVIAFSKGVPGTASAGLECQVRAVDEQIHFEKSGATITVLP